MLEVQLSHAHGEVKWYKDGEKLQDTGHVRLEEDGQRRALVILGATDGDAGEYLCDTQDDSVIFCVTVEGNREHIKWRWAEWAGKHPVSRCVSPAPEPPVSIVGNLGTTEHRCLVAGQDLVLACELSQPDAAVRWLRDGQELQPGERVCIVARGALRELTVRGAQPGDSGYYVCDAASDRMVTSVEVTGERGWQDHGWQHQVRARALSPKSCQPGRGRSGPSDPCLPTPPGGGWLNLSLAGSQAPLLLLWLPRAELSKAFISAAGCVGIPAPKKVWGW